jgi:hypothetical protein
VSRKVKRELAVIAAELQGALKRETADIIAIGALLNEAQEQLDHGEWLEWLRTHFGSSPRTAQNYMRAAKFAAKNETVAHLKLRPSCIYRISGDDPYDLYGRKAIKAIFKAAETEWITGDRAEQIAKSLLPPPAPPSKEALAAIEAAEKARLEAEAAAQKEIDDILANPPPPPPPAPESTVRDVTLSPFEQAVKTLAHLQTKPLASFAATKLAPDRIRAIGDFLRAVADAIEKPKPEQQQQQQPCQSD